MDSASSHPEASSSGKTGVRVSFWPLALWNELLITSYSVFTVDAVNELNIPGLDVPQGTPGAGGTAKFRVRYRNEKARTLLGLEFRDKLTIARDTIADIQSKGWC